MNVSDCARQHLSEADTVIVAAGNGLSISEGIHIFGSNADFYQNFGDFSEKYGFHNMIQGCFYPFRRPEAYWAYFARLYDYMNRLKPVGTVMGNLLKILENKEYFIVTGSFDNCFRRAGFDTERLFEIEGTGKDLQCVACCTDEVIDGSDILAGLARIENGEIPADTIPHCPHCGGPVKIHVQLDDHFQTDRVWRERQAALQARLEQGKTGRTVVLELGMGAQNRLIKQPLMNYVYQNPNTFYISINKGGLWIPDAIAGRSAGIDSGIAEVLEDWVQTL